LITFFSRSAFHNFTILFNPHSLEELISGKKEVTDKLTHKKNTTPQNLLLEKQKITNKFTYFDCTDYKDDKNGKKVTPVSLSARKQALDFWNYAKLVIAHLIFHKIDTHGGYFNGDFSKELIYKLAFFGFDSLLESYSSEAPKNGIDTLSIFSNKCEEKQIQVVLSPERMPKK
jgi:hypothetical protein